jgi:hypothetical protein
MEAGTVTTAVVMSAPARGRILPIVVVLQKRARPGGAGAMVQRHGVRSRPGKALTADRIMK